MVVWWLQPGDCSLGTSILRATDGTTSTNAFSESFLMGSINIMEVTEAKNE
jgi:hypothetical protein